MNTLKLGMRVTTTSQEPAYYSGYGGRPECTFRPGDVGSIGALDVPPVRGKRAGFHCVDFQKHGQQWRVALWPEQVVPV